jgi:hypothetical protein
MHNGLCDCIPRRIVGVEDPPPVGVDLVNVVAIPERMGAVLSHQVGNLTPRLVRLGHVLAQAVGHIDPKPVDSAVGPEANGAAEVLANFLVLPVEVRLLSSETVEIPLAVTSRCPGRSAEERFPVVGR